MRRSLAGMFALAALLWATVASGHPLAPLVLEMVEGGDGVVEASLKEPAVRPRGAHPGPIWPRGCRPLGEPARRSTEDARITSYRLACEGLVGERIGMSGLSGLNAVLRIELADGHVHQALLDESEASSVISAAPGSLTVLRDYAALGIRHLMGGLDHLLFVVGLLMVVASKKRLVLALTAFTLGHSLTLGAATLGWVRLPTGPVEVGIALSLVVVALEVVRRQEQDDGRAGPRSVMVAGVFGLLHGFGFAGALSEAGLAAGEIPLALLGFNLGIELGQLAVVLVAWGLVGAARRLDLAEKAPKSLARLRLAPAYVIGSLAVMWCFERAATWLG